MPGRELAKAAKQQWKRDTYADVCSRMLTYAHVCSRMRTYAQAAKQQWEREAANMQRELSAVAQVESWRMRAYADVCVTYADVC